METMVGVDKMEDPFEEEETDPFENGEELNWTACDKTSDSLPSSIGVRWWGRLHFRLG